MPVLHLSQELYQTQKLMNFICFATYTFTRDSLEISVLKMVLYTSNKSDMCHGDDGYLLDHQKIWIEYIKINKGGKVLLDDYKIIHGLNVFSMPRMCGATYPDVKDGKV